MGWWGGTGRVAAALGTALAVASCAQTRPDAIRPPSVEDTAVLEVVPGTALGETVRLTFAWPEVLDGWCTSRVRRAAVGEPVSGGTVTFQVHATRDAEGLRITSYEPVALAGGTVLADSSDSTPAITELVDTDGRHLGIDGIEAALSQVRAGAASTPAARAAFAQRLRAQAARNWKLLVGAWIGREVPLGATYAASAPESVPDGGSVRMHIAIRADGRVPCEPGASEHRCVRLRLRSQPDDADLMPLVPGMLRELLPDSDVDAATAVVQRLVATTDVVLVTEPDTLLPHRISHRRLLGIRLNTATEPVVEREVSEEVTRVCRWRVAS